MKSEWKQNTYLLLDIELGTTSCNAEKRQKLRMKY